MCWCVIDNLLPMGQIQGQIRCMLKIGGGQVCDDDVHQMPSLVTPESHDAEMEIRKQEIFENERIFIFPSNQV